MAEDIEASVRDWDRTCKALPTWEEMLQVEYVRQRGEINMITDNVYQYCSQNGLSLAMAWYRKCSENKKTPMLMYSIALQHFEKLHGPRGTWLTPQIRNRFDLLSVSLQEKALKEQMKLLKKQKRQLENRQ